MTAHKLILMRHGLTDWNADGRFQGQADVELNEIGRSQAREAALALTDAGITSIVSSDLVRAVETARTVGAELGLIPRLDPRLQEINVGTWAGWTMKDAAQADPDFLPALREGRDFRRSPSGETATEAGIRVAAALREHASAAADDTVLLAVGHGLGLRLAAVFLMGLQHHHARLFTGLWNCHWLTMAPGEDHWRMLGYNQGGCSS